MNSLSRLSIILMSTILVISVNSSCMEKQISCACSQSDYQKLMNIIEERLVMGEIQKYDIRYVEHKLSGIKQREFLQSLNTHQNKPVFIIKKTFFKPKIKKDLLTQSIFEAIELRHHLDYKSDLPKQSLSDQIRYYVIKDKPAILVVAKLTNKEHIQEIVDRYNKAKNDCDIKLTSIINGTYIKKNSLFEHISTIKISTAIVSFVCLLLALSQVHS
jgi:hypothetical protein